MGARASRAGRAAAAVWRGLASLGAVVARARDAQCGQPSDDGDRGAREGTEEALEQDPVDDDAEDAEADALTSVQPQKRLPQMHAALFVEAAPEEGDLVQLVQPEQATTKTVKTNVQTMVGQLASP